MCGADAIGLPNLSSCSGSSPRVRSRRIGRIGGSCRRRIISACAEQTDSEEPKTELPGDHLRVCGADSRLFGCQFRVSGSSPRVRSRRAPNRYPTAQTGIISACAEQTRPQAARRAAIRDHLRVCGADRTESRQGQRNQGSSPRVRSRHHPRPYTTTELGIISACAEQTCPRYHRRPRSGDHLRVCGADLVTLE